VHDLMTSNLDFKVPRRPVDALDVLYIYAHLHSWRSKRFVTRKEVPSAFWGPARYAPKFWA